MITERLILRQWKTSDLDPFAAMCANPSLMQYYPSTLNRSQVEQFLIRIQTHFEQHGFGLWALENRQSHAFIGYAGLMVPRFTASFTPCVEIGWRIDESQWNKGFATEAALKALEIGFKRHGLDEILSFTVPSNRPSRRVMEKIGMTYDAKDEFEHPSIVDGHPLKRHVLYRLRRIDYEKRTLNGLS